MSRHPKLIVHPNMADAKAARAADIRQDNVGAIHGYLGQPQYGYQYDEIEVRVPAHLLTTEYHQDYLDHLFVRTPSLVIIDE